MIQDNETREVLGSFKEAIDLLLIKVQNLEERAKIAEEGLKSLETKFIEEIYEPAKQAFDEAVDNENFRQFSEKYSEKLSPYADQINAVEGGDFDIMRNLYDEYNSMEVEEGQEKMSQDEYIEKIIPHIEEQLNTIRKKLGVETLEVKVEDSTGDGKADAIEIKADGEEVTGGEPGSDDGEGKKDDTPVEIVDSANSTEDIIGDPEEIRRFEEELAESLGK